MPLPRAESAVSASRALRVSPLEAARRIWLGTVSNPPAPAPNLRDSLAATRSGPRLKFSAHRVSARSLPEHSRSASPALRRVPPRVPKSTSARARFHQTPATETFHPHLCETSSHEISSADSEYYSPSQASA